MSKSRLSLFVVSTTAFIDLLGLGLVAPVIPKIVSDITGVGASAAAVYGGWLLFAFAAVQFASAPLLGALSDRFGRRPILLLSLFTLGIDYLAMAVTSNLMWLFVARIVSGIFSSTFATISAYVVDVTPPEERAKAFGLVGGVGGLGFVVGPALGGILGEVSPHLPFFAAAGLALANGLFGVFVLKESLPPSARRPFSWTRAHPMAAFTHVRRYPAIAPLFLAVGLLAIVAYAPPSVMNFYLAAKFAWTPSQMGYLMAYAGVTFSLTSAFAVGALVSRMGERQTIYLSLMCGMAGFIGFAFAPNGLVMYLAQIPFGFVAVAQATIGSVISRQAPADAQGELQGLIASVTTLAALPAPLMLTGVFRLFTAPGAPIHFPGAPFLLATALLLVSLLVLQAALSEARPNRSPA